MDLRTTPCVGPVKNQASVSFEWVIIFQSVKN